MNREIAERIFEERLKCRTGKWAAHSRNVACAASEIAIKADLDPERAYCMGLLHDIGRSFTEGQFQHIVFGYEYMQELGYDEIARICLTHSFPVQNIYSYVGKVDICEQARKVYQDKLQKISYDWYDELIQLCDAVSVDTGYVIPERRFVELVFKYGFNSYTIEKWKATLKLKEKFDSCIHADIVQYLLQNIAEFFK